MNSLLHRFAPERARSRMLLTTALVGPTVIGALSTPISGSPSAIVVAVLATVAAAGLAVSLGAGLVQQAEAAPQEATPTAQETPTAKPETDPIATLQQRDAVGELSDAEFEQGLDCVLESAVGQTEPASGHDDKRSRDRAVER
jgi:hypothetical protein